MLLILKVPVVVLNTIYVKGGSLRSLNVICNYILMGKAGRLLWTWKQTKVYFMAITLVKVTILLATFVNVWHSILQFIHIPYVLWAQD
jgi:hypothetical protein